MTTSIKAEPRGQIQEVKPKNQGKLPGKLVYFAYKRGKAVFKSADRRVVELEGGRHREIREAPIEMFFTHGVSQGFDPKIPEDREMIELVRKTLADGEKNNWRGDYERFKLGNLREVRPNSPAPPFSTWDETAAKRLPQIVKDLKLDVDHCIEYEAFNQARDSVIAALEALRETPDTSDPLATSV